MFVDKQYAWRMWHERRKSPGSAWKIKFFKNSLKAKLSASCKKYFIAG